MNLVGRERPRDARAIDGTLWSTDRAESVSAWQD
jgi:hypothetical protein